MRTVRRLCLVAAVALLGACGGGVAAPSTTTGTPETIEVTATDYAFEGLPDRVPVGTTVTMVNESDKEVHEFVAVRLPDEEERSVDELVQLPPEELATFFPMVETVIVAAPGENGLAVEGTGVLSEPGRYAILCVIPTGADPHEYMAAAAEAEGGPPQVEGGLPHIVNGMYAEIQVG